MALAFFNLSTLFSSSLSCISVPIPSSYSFFCLSNKKEAALLDSADYLEQLSDDIVVALRQYIYQKKEIQAFGFVN